jgi:HSP20 family molecular chaperone IbpA
MRLMSLDEGKAKFDSGLLIITIPFQKPAQPKEISIE